MVVNIWVVFIVEFVLKQILLFDEQCMDVVLWDVFGIYLLVDVVGIVEKFLGDVIFVNMLLVGMVY